MKLSDIATRLACELRGDGSIEIRRLAPIDDAGPGDLTFVANPRYRAHLKTTRASAVIVASGEEDVALPTLRAGDPYAAFAQAIDLFYTPPPQMSGIHASAVIHPTARLGDDVHVGPYCVVGENVTVGNGAHIDAHVVIYPEVRIGNQFHAFANVVIRERVVIGDRVILQSGCVIGGDGFGYVLGADGSVRKITQGGTVILEDDVEVGANSTIDRAAIGATVLRRGAKLDNLVMVAHGCTVGEGSALAAQTGLSGSTRVGRFVRMGGQVGAAGHLTIGDGAQIAAQSGIANDVPAGTTVGGYPAVEIHQWRRQIGALGRLPDLLRRVRRIEAALKLLDKE
jgi:UDP-3-O-[3-hydroxymyristoyl] glucosamine N-acyltransferase